MRHANHIRLSPSEIKYVQKIVQQVARIVERVIGDPYDGT